MFDDILWPRFLILGVNSLYKLRALLDFNLCQKVVGGLLQGSGIIQFGNRTVG